jgi:hypothetical protein
MNWYDLIQGYESDDQPFYVSRKGDLEGCKWWHFSEGKTVQNWKSRAWIKSTSAAEDAPPNDGLVNHFGLLIFSSRMRIALETSGVSGIQYLPIRVMTSDGTDYPGYSIANILNEPSALDLQKSDFSVFPQDYFALEDRGRISGIRRAVLKGSALRDFHIVRLKEFHEAVYVSQSFVDIYNRNKFTGYSFNEVQLSP